MLLISVKKKRISCFEKYVHCTMYTPGCEARSMRKLILVDKPEILNSARQARSLSRAEFRSGPHTTSLAIIGS